MAWLESNRGRLLIGFRYRGERCREYLDLDDNRDNHRLADRTLKEIEGELASGKFDYAARFPESPRLAHFGLTPQPVPAAQEDQKPETPTLGEFAESWLEERRIVLTWRPRTIIIASSKRCFCLLHSRRSRSTRSTTATSIVFSAS